MPLRQAAPLLLPLMCRDDMPTPDAAMRYDYVVHAVAMNLQMPPHHHGHRLSQRLSLPFIFAFAIDAVLMRRC